MNAQTQVNGNNYLVQGRLLWTTGNSIFEGKKKTDYNTGVPILDESGQSVIEYGFGLAIPKLDPRTGQYTAEFTKIWQLLHQEAFTLYPSGQVPKDFAMKFKDGDTDIDDKGVPYSKREGYAGHIVLACTTQIPVKFFIFQGGNNILINNGIKCGDYVNVQLNVKAHPAKGRGKAGLYLNPSAVQLIQPGKEIINTPSGDQMFGMQAPAYKGQVEAHVGPVMPNIAAAPSAHPSNPAMPPMGAPAYNQPVQPNWNVVPPQHQPMQAPAMPGQPLMGNAAPPVEQEQMQYGQPVYQNMSAPSAYPSNPAMPPMPGMR